MDLLTPKIITEIKNNIIIPAIDLNYQAATQRISQLIDELRDNIPENKRISYGRVYTVKLLSAYLFEVFEKQEAPVFEIASRLFECGNDYKSQGVALGILSLFGLGDHQAVLPYFEKAANSENWDVREMAQMFFRKLINKYPTEMKAFLLRQVKSPIPNLRRFASETLRPVQENKWFYKNPEYSLSILKHLFAEAHRYPRTSVGNNLSDLSRKCPTLIYDLVEQLVNSHDKNSYWIAYRACRNLVKSDPISVMNLLKVDEYKYKGKVYKRSEYQRN